jgi:hypothetical protein
MTLIHHYKDRPVRVTYGNARSFIVNGHMTYKYNIWAESEVTYR